MKKKSFFQFVIIQTERIVYRYRHLQFSNSTYCPNDSITVFKLGRYPPSASRWSLRPTPPTFLAGHGSTRRRKPDLRHRSSNQPCSGNPCCYLRISKETALPRFFNCLNFSERILCVCKCQFRKKNVGMYR